MKVIHCADLHLDSKMQANLGKDKAKERKLELLNTFSRMVEYAKREGVEAILICGDMFDTKSISALSRNAVLNSIEENPDICFFYLKGNHDSDGFVSALETVPENLYLFNDAWTEYPLGDNDIVKLYGVELDSNNSASVQAAFAPDPSKVNIVMLHGQEAETVGKDKAEIINIRQFQNKGINYMALGHIHAPKLARLDATGQYAYSGCLEGRGFDETGEHGFMLLDIDEEKKSVFAEFVPFAYRELYEIHVDISDAVTSPEIVTLVRNALIESTIQQKDLVKIVLEGNVDVECEKDIDFIKHSFEADYYFVKVYDFTEYKVDYDSFLLDESLKGEFVRLCMKDESLSEAERGEIVRLGLHVISGGKIE